MFGAVKELERMRGVVAAHEAEAAEFAAVGTPEAAEVAKRLRARAADFAAGLPQMERLVAAGPKVCPEGECRCRDRDRTS